MIENRTYNVRQNSPFGETAFDRLKVIEEEIMQALIGKTIVIKNTDDIIIPLHDPSPSDPNPEPHKL